MLILNFCKHLKKELESLLKEAEGSKNSVKLELLRSTLHVSVVVYWALLTSFDHVVSVTLLLECYHTGWGRDDSTVHLSASRRQRQQGRQPSSQKPFLCSSQNRYRTWVGRESACALTVRVQVYYDRSVLSIDDCRAGLCTDWPWKHRRVWSLLSSDDQVAYQRMFSKMIFLLQVLSVCPLFHVKPNLWRAQRNWEERRWKTTGERLKLTCFIQCVMFIFLL